MKKVYLYDNDGYFAGEDFPQIDPLESQKAGREILIMPANSTDIEPPEEREGFRIKFVNSSWEYVEEEKTEELPQKYIPTPKDLLMQQIYELKNELLQSDYKAIKFSEGWISEKDYAPIREERQEIRNRINSLQEELDKLKE